MLKYNTYLSTPKTIYFLLKKQLLVGTKHVTYVLYIRFSLLHVSAIDRHYQEVTYVGYIV